MISWMQKHNRYLIVTIWIATIAFIGAGFVGWGSYQYGSKASAIGKVGDIEITQEKFDMTYQSLYERYNELLKGQFDKARAQEMNLPAQAFNALATQAKLLNLAKEYGIVVSKDELGKYILSIKGFQNNGVFSKDIYDRYLRRRGLKKATFEGVLRDELVVNKLMGLLGSDALAYETKVLAQIQGISDKIAYKIVNLSDIEVKLDEKEIKSYWDQFKTGYMTPTAYKVEILWTDTSDTEVNEKDLRAYMETNAHKYLDENGVPFTFKKAKLIVEQDYKIEKAKGKALKEYVAFKKGNIGASESKELFENDSILSSEIWNKILQSKENEILKPKISGKRYATVKVVKIIDPKIKSYEESKEEIINKMTIQKQKELLESKAKEALVKIDNENLTTTDWMRLDKFEKMSPMSKEETSQFLQKLFTSSEKKGIITVSSSTVVYKVVKQKLDDVDSDGIKVFEAKTTQTKRNVFESNLFKELSKQYKVQKFVKGI